MIVDRSCMAAGATSNRAKEKKQHCVKVWEELTWNTAFNLATCIWLIDQN